MRATDVRSTCMKQTAVPAKVEDARQDLHQLEPLSFIHSERGERRDRLLPLRAVVDAVNRELA